MRIASLLPSATEIVCALGLEDQLVAVTHECDFPAGVKGKPVVTASVLSPDTTSAAIDRHIRRLVHEGSSIYHLDADRLAALDPDLILTQELCQVCAVSYPIVEAAARRLGGATQLVSLEPECLSEVFGHLQLVGRLTDRIDEADRVVAGLQERVSAVTRLVEQREPRRVLCLEWVDPLFGSGHWTPELVQLAGGQALLGSPRQPARLIAWEEVVAAAPDVIVVMACGFSLERSLQEMLLLETRPAWAELPAVRAGDVYVVDGNAYFSRPGPRLVDSVEIMTGLLHPDLVAPLSPQVARRWAGHPP
jgi:iron complex transport system substrate-binding protein